MLGLGRRAVLKARETTNLFHQGREYARLSHFTGTELETLYNISTPHETPFDKGVLAYLKSQGYKGKI